MEKRHAECLLVSSPDMERTSSGADDWKAVDAGESTAIGCSGVICDSVFIICI
jgi:hypothetical protein